MKIRVWWRVIGNPLHPFSHRLQPPGEQCQMQHKKRWRTPPFVTANRRMDALLTWCWGRFSEDLGGVRRDIAMVSVVQKSWAAAVEAQSALPPKQDGDGDSRFTHPPHTKRDEEQVTMGELVGQESLSPPVHQHQNHLLCSSPALITQLFS